jgi:acyl dehydratase
MTRYFEDYTVGETRTVGSFSLSESEIIDFAERFDPLWLHTDPEQAEAMSPFGGIIASGWHTLCSCHGLLIAEVGDDSMALGSPGVEDISWSKPVFPGDTLTVESEVVATRPSESQPDRGLVTTEITATNDDEETVLAYRPLMFFLRRDN